MKSGQVKTHYFKFITLQYEKNLSEIIKDIEQIFEIDDISLRYRGTDYVMARYLYMHLARKFTKRSLKQIGQPINLKHCQVIYGLKKFDILLPYFFEIKYILYELDKRYTNEYYAKQKFDTIEVIHCDLLNGKILTEVQLNKLY